MQAGQAPAASVPQRQHLRCLGSSLGGAVRRLAYTFNGQGLPYRSTSDSDPFNGFRQVTSESV